MSDFAILILFAAVAAVVISPVVVWMYREWVKRVTFTLTVSDASNFMPGLGIVIDRGGPNEENFHIVARDGDVLTVRGKR